MRSAQASASPVLLVQDTFTDTNGTDIESHAADVGGLGWSAGWGVDDWTIQSNRLESPSGEDVVAYPLSALNQVTEIVCTINSDSGSYPGINFRSDSTGDNFWCLYISPDEVQFWTYGHGASGWTQRGSPATTSANDDGEDHIFRIVIENELATVFRDGVEIITAYNLNEVGANEQGVGFYCYGVTRFDDLEVRGYPA